ncbi:hypothetical protein PoB_007235400 [Plakobranchus ocellatus]|uniref:Uncharacterized protein n=1 Tax=Plakobranchus ocellatus TaxID=259542 RepID=A0AAV4DNR6_9GAST|nr:hypothetical protein PoB_007235400 [Plakobranchus ocellatus]
MTSAHLSTACTGQIRTTCLVITDQASMIPRQDVIRTSQPSSLMINFHVLSIVGTVDSEPALRSAATILSWVRASLSPPPGMSGRRWHSGFATVFRPSSADNLQRATSPRCFTLSNKWPPLLAARGVSKHIELRT